MFVCEPALDGGGGVIRAGVEAGGVAEALVKLLLVLICGGGDSIIMPLRSEEEALLLLRLSVVRGEDIREPFGSGSPSGIMFDVWRAGSAAGAAIVALVCWIPVSFVAGFIGQALELTGTEFGLMAGGV